MLYFILEFLVGYNISQYVFQEFLQVSAIQHCLNIISTLF